MAENRSGSVRVAVLTQNGNFVVNRTSRGNLEITGGYEAPFLNMLMEGLHLKPIIYAAERDEWGRLLDNGTWTGLIGMVHRKEVDMAVSSILVTEDRMEAIEFSYPYSIEDVTFATRMPGYVPTASALIRPFSEDLWISLLICLIVFTFLYHLLMTKKYSLTKILLALLGCIVNQPISLKTRQIRDRFLVGAWLAGTVFLPTMYGSFLLSFLTLPIRENPIRDVGELSEAVSDGIYKCYTTKESSLLGSLLMSSQNYTKVIAEAISKNNWLLLSNFSVFEKYARMDKTAIIRTRRYIRNVFQDDVYVPDDSFYSAFSAIVLQKQSSLTLKINRLLRIIAASGIYSKATEYYLFHKSLRKNLNNSLKNEISRKISLKDLKSAFLFLILGNLISCAVCLLEILWDNCRRYNSENSTTQRVFKKHVKRITPVIS